MALAEQWDKWAADHPKNQNPMVNKFWKKKGQKCHACKNLFSEKSFTSDKPIYKCKLRLGVNGFHPRHNKDWDACYHFAKKEVAE